MLVCYFATMQTIPAVDLLGEDAVRLLRGDFTRVIFRQPFESFVELVVATGPALIHVVDLEGARDGAVRLDVLERCVRAARGTPIQVSGGLRSVSAARAALDRGAARVLIGTALWEDDGALRRFTDELGERFVAALDVRDDHVAVRGWALDAPLTFDEALEKCVDGGVHRLHVTAIERDGTMGGPDLALYQRACATGLAVIAAGGVRHQGDLDALEAVGCEGAVMGVGYLDRLETLPDKINE